MALKKFIDDSKIINNLNETQIGNVLDATQGKVLERDKAPKANAAFTGTMTLNNETVATTRKIDIFPTQSVGYKIVNNNSCKINNVVYYNFAIEQTDGSAFSVISNNVKFCEVPYIGTQGISLATTGHNGTTTLGKAELIISASKSVWGTVSVGGFTKLYVSGVVAL